MIVSVITVTFNAEKYLLCALKSVAEQTYQGVEHIIIDGGSSDGTLSLVKSLVNHNSQLRYISGPDKGIADAMNKGLSLATGDIIAFLHSDDFYSDKDVLERVSRVFSKYPEMDWLTGGIHYVNSSGQIIRTYSVRCWSYKKLLRGNILFHPATFVRKKAIESVGGFDNSLNFSMDYDLWLKLGKRNNPYLIEGPLACFRVHSESISVKNIDAAFKEEFKVRCRHIKGSPLSKLFHWLYYWVKFLPNRQSLKM